MTKILTEKVLVVVIKFFADQRSPNYPAMRTLIKEAGCSPKVVTATIALMLNRYDKSRNDRCWFPDTDALSFALEQSGLRFMSQQLALRLVRTAAQAGFIGRFPGITTDLLGRGPNAEEIRLLVGAYVENKASRCEHTEMKLREMARKFLPREQARQEEERIDQFVKDWNNTIDL